MRAAPWALLLLALLPAALADHVPTNPLVIQLPDTGLGLQVACVGFALQEPVQVGRGCLMWCFSDGGCAVFFTGLAQRPLPFHVVYTDAVTHEPVTVYPGEGGYVCMFTWNMGANFHFTLVPDPFPLPGMVGYANAVKDEGAHCLL